MHFVAWVLVSAIFMVSRVASDTTTRIPNTCPSDRIVQLDVNMTGVEIQSPYYPGWPTSYLIQDCRWRFTPTVSGMVVAFEFLLHDLSNSTNCEKVYVAFHDGPYEESPVMAKVCGPDLPVNISSTVDEMFIYYKISNKVRGEGFTGRAYLVPAPPAPPTTPAPATGTSTTIIIVVIVIIVLLLLALLAFCLYKKKKKDEKIVPVTSEENMEKTLVEKKSESNQALDKGKSNQSLDKGKSNQSLDKGKSNQALDKGKSNQALDEGKSNQALDKGKSNQAVDEGKSNQALDKGKSNQALDEGKSNPALDKGKSKPALDGGEAE